MSDSKYVRSIGDIRLIRYGDEHGRLDPLAATRVAAFVLGFDVETNTTALNERAYDIVKPISEFWRPEDGIADIEIVDRKNNMTICLNLGDWVARYPNGRLRAFAHNRVLEGAFPLSMEHRPLPDFKEELRSLITKHRSKIVFSRVPVDILADYMLQSMGTFDEVARKATWPRQDGAE